MTRSMIDNAAVSIAIERKYIAPPHDRFLPPFPLMEEEDSHVALRSKSMAGIGQPTRRLSRLGVRRVGNKKWHAMILGLATAHDKDTELQTISRTDAPSFLIRLRIAGRCLWTNEPDPCGRSVSRPPHGGYTVSHALHGDRAYERR